MKWVIRIMGVPGNVTQVIGATRQGMVGMYVTGYDPDAHDGRGDVSASRDRAAARRFESAQGAFNWWKRESTVRPYRPDGMPNRPATAFTVSLEQAPDEEDGT